MHLLQGPSLESALFMQYPKRCLVRHEVALVDTAFRVGRLTRLLYEHLFSEARIAVLVAQNIFAAFRLLLVRGAGRYLPALLSAYSKINCLNEAPIHHLSLKSPFYKMKR